MKGIWSPRPSISPAADDQIPFTMDHYRAAVSRLVIRSAVVFVAVVVIARVAVRGWTDAQLT